MPSDELKWFYRNAAERTLAALAQRNIDGLYVDSPADALGTITQKVPMGARIGLGGSRTLEELGILEMLRNGKYDLLDQYAPGLPREEQLRLRREGTLAPWFLSGVNAIAETGELVFIDGMCNRVAGVLYNAEKVLLVSGVNKICPDLPKALWRAQHIAGPTNAKRLNTGSPCTEAGICSDCNNERRICNATAIIHRQRDPGRIFLLLVSGEYGL
jgi:hypothetical protein